MSWPCSPYGVSLTEPSRSEGLFVGGSSGSALSGAIRFLHSPAGHSIANDPEANVVVILPDGVRNYMSKPWFLDVAEDASMKDLRGHIRGVLGRELNDPGAVVELAKEEGTTLQAGEGLESSPEGTEATLVEKWHNPKVAEADVSSDLAELRLAA